MNNIPASPASDIPAAHPAILHLAPAITRHSRLAQNHLEFFKSLAFFPLKSNNTPLFEHC
jgi:hypothetical protein